MTFAADAKERLWLGNGIRLAATALRVFAEEYPLGGPERKVLELAAIHIDEAEIIPLNDARGRV